MGHVLYRFLIIVFCPLVLGGSFAQAQTMAVVRAVFIEGAPADMFEFTNIGDCELGETELTVDLSTSTSGLVFDVTGIGAGVAAYHRLEIVKGGDFIHRVSKLKDGDTMIHFELERFPVGGVISFYVDIDDSLEASSGGNIQVFDSELEGTVVKVGSEWTAFEANSVTMTPPLKCEA